MIRINESGELVYEERTKKATDTHISSRIVFNEDTKYPEKNIIEERYIDMGISYGYGVKFGKTILPDF